MREFRCQRLCDLNCAQGSLSTRRRCRAAMRFRTYAGVILCNGPREGAFAPLPAILSISLTIFRAFAITGMRLVRLTKHAMSVTRKTINPMGLLHMICSTEELEDGLSYHGCSCRIDVHSPATSYWALTTTDVDVKCQAIKRHVFIAWSSANDSMRLEVM